MITLLIPRSSWANATNKLQTILSGDLNGDDGPNFSNNDENAYHVISNYNLDATAVLDGFTVSEANASGTT